MSSSVLSYLRHLLPTAEAYLPDQELLHHFAATREQAAFTELLRRYGPLVWGVCRRVLGDAHAAEDAFQATFLQLARRAGTLERSGSLAGWLHTVATRLAGRAGRAEERRRRRERVRRSPMPTPPDDLTWRELRQIIDAEIARLPEPYRQPLILCYLEDRPQLEVARRLGISPGVLRGRLERGRQKLRGRLEKLGLPLAAALLLTSADTVPAALVEATRQMVMRVLAGAPMPRAVAALLTGGTLFSRLKIGIVAVVLLVAGGIGMGGARREAQPAAAPPAREELAQVQRGVDALGDPLPPGAIRRLGTRRHRIQSSWQSWPDGKSYLALQGTSRACEIRRLDALTGRLLEVWPVPKKYHVAGISPNGRYALMSNDFIGSNVTRLETLVEIQPKKEAPQQWMLTLYDLEKRCTVWQQQEMLGREEWKHVGQACFTADGKWIATKGQHVRLWDATTGKELWKTNVQRPEPLGFLDGGKTLVLHGWENNSISLVDRATGKQCRSFPMTKRAETRDSEYVLSPDGSAVLCGSYGPLVRVWDMATGKERPALEGHKTWTRYFAFTPDCKTIVTGGNDPFALVRDWPSGKVVRTIELGRPYIARMAISRDGRRLEVQFWGEQELQLYDLKTGKLLPPPGDGHRGDVIGAAVAPDGRLLSFGRDATIRTWEIQTGRIVGRMPVEQDLNGGGFAVSGDGRLLATTNRGLDAVLVYDRATGKQLHKLPAAERIFGKQLVFSSDGRWLARTQRLGGDIQVWDVSTGRTVLQCKHEVEYGIACAFSPDGRQFAASDHGRVRFWDLRTWREQPEWKVSAPLGLAYSPDGRTLAAASVEGIRLFELATHRERAHIQAAGYPEGVLRFSSTGRWLAWTTNSVAQRIHEKKLWPPTGGEGIFVWDIHRGEMLSSFTGHEGDITGLDFGVDDRALVSSSQDSTLLVWDIAGKIAKQPPRKAGDVERAWRDLLGDDAKAAYEAIRVLSASPDAAIKLLARNLKPAPIDKKGIDAWLRDLDSDDFAARERATRELERLGEQAVPALERFLAGKPSLEARRRVELLLEKSHGPTPEHLRQIRALEALERIGDDDARRLLEALAKGTADTWLTRDAKASLERIRR